MGFPVTICVSIYSSSLPSIYLSFTYSIPSSNLLSSLWASRSWFRWRWPSWEGRKERKLRRQKKGIKKRGEKRKKVLCGLQEFDLKKWRKSNKRYKDLRIKERPLLPFPTSHFLSVFSSHLLPFLPIFFCLLFTSSRNIPRRVSYYLEQIHRYGWKEERLEKSRMGIWRDIKLRRKKRKRWRKRKIGLERDKDLRIKERPQQSWDFSHYVLKLKYFAVFFQTNLL